MEESATSIRGASSRHSILDLAPLELECLSALWPLGEGTVRDICRQLTVARPRAYTTIMTIMDRLTRKGIVTRRKIGRAYRYQASLSSAAARASAVEKIVMAFFDGSAESLAAYLAALGGAAGPLGAFLPARPAARGSEASELSRGADGTDTPADPRQPAG